MCRFLPFWDSFLLDWGRVEDMFFIKINEPAVFFLNVFSPVMHDYNLSLDNETSHLNRLLPSQASSVSEMHLELLTSLSLYFFVCSS